MSLTRWCCAPLSVAIILLGLAVGVVAAVEPLDTIREHLQAGEFPAAKSLADQLPPRERDRALAELALAQARTGARAGWAETVRGIRDEQLRYGSLSDTPAKIGSGSSARLNTQNSASAPAATGSTRGGAAAADFTSLIDLIKKTTGTPKPGWIDDGGVGTVEKFPGGVLIDTQGSLGKLKAGSGKYFNARHASARAESGNRDIRRESEFRKVSLTKLERELQIRRALGQEPDEAMRLLAGLNKVEYLMVYPDSGEIVLAGPAANWHQDGEGRIVSAANGRPVLQLDDLIVLLRHAFGSAESTGCSIDPRPHNLERLQEYLRGQNRPLKPGERDKWVSNLRDLAGVQDIRVFGIDPRTRVAQILVEADYRMKLVGMGLEEGTPGVKSYLDTIEVDAQGQVPPMSVLRWWFTMNYDAVQSTESHDAFAWVGSGVQVLSENQLLAAQGKRIATGQSDELNTRFAESFTRHFAALAEKYPIYAELQNVFDLSLVCALLQSQDLPGQVGWQMSHFRNLEACPVALGPAPKEVLSVVNHRVIRGKHVVAGVSGGVSVQPRTFVAPDRIRTDQAVQLHERHSRSPQPQEMESSSWWWD
ncbi:MAG: DUF1598 domain-containing protein [Planctomycetes bacterium]|nr:DUF1598 domain-containing protein [Planctomycetota bacterium]